MYVQKILILFIFLVSTVFSNVREISAAGNSAGSQKPLRFYENLGGDFELTGPDGKELSSESFRGKVILIYFGYTYCPDVCPMSLSHLKVGMLNLKEQAKDVQVLFISIDSERDTPEKLKNTYHTFIQLLLD